MKTIGLQRSVHGLDADAIAAGVWLRQEIADPKTLDPASLNAPVRLWLREPSLYAMLGIVYTAGFPNQIQDWKGPDPGASSMKRGQYLLSDRPIDDPAFVPQTRHGRYTVYRLQPEK
jgi:hypothetical protein